jgi:hypothetical protein
MVGLIHRDEFSTADKVAEMLADAIANASMGARNETGFKLARALRDLGLSRAAAEPIMKSYQSAILHKFPNADPYGLRESLATLSSVYQRSSAIPGRREREIKVHEETSGTDLNVPPGFFLGSDGVYATDSSGYFRVCSRLEVTGFARGLRNGNWGIVLKFNDRDRNMHEWVMPMELLASDGTEIRGRLLSMGLEIEPGTPVRHALSRYISLAKSEGRVRLVLLWLVR